MFTFVPMFHAWSRLKTPRQFRIALGFTAAAIVTLTLSASAPVDANGAETGVVGNLAGAVGAISLVCGLIAVGLVRPKVYGPRAQPAAAAPATRAQHDDAISALLTPDGRSDPTVAAALSSRSRREASRELAQRDPLLARELHVGRPDRRGEYDDGGLVDLNSAPDRTIADVLELDAGTVSEIVAARVRFAGFSNVDEVVTCVALTPGQEAVLRDRAVVLPR